MTKKEQATFGEFREHARSVRKETRAMFKSVLPEAFWDHASASKKEARLACAAFRRAIKRQFSLSKATEPRTKQKIEIA